MCVDGSTIETHGVVEAKIRLCSRSTTHSFQLVSKHVDIPCDGILGREFFQRTRAKICYETRTVTLYGQKYKMIGRAVQLGEKWIKAAQITLPRGQRVLCGYRWRRDHPR